MREDLEAGRQSERSGPAEESDHRDRRVEAQTGSDRGAEEEAEEREEAEDISPRSLRAFRPCGSHAQQTGPGRLAPYRRGS